MLCAARAISRIAKASPSQNARSVRRTSATHRRIARNLHVAIVGSGPAGFYAADELLRSSIKGVQIDMYERLPTPYGLVRYGVAPDHPEVKAVEKVFHQLALLPGFNFVGNVTVGKDVTIEELQDNYQLIVLAYGAEDDRKLGIPGENLKGVHSARTFVEWYNSLANDRSSEASQEFDLSGPNVTIIGNGNVAVDVARILLKNPTELSKTDISEVALEALKSSQVSNVSLIGRRGPVQAAYTTAELRELLSLSEVAKLIPDGALQTTEADEIELQQRPTKRKFELLKKLLLAPIPDSSLKQLRFLFLRSPLEFVEDPNRPGHVGSIKVAHNFLLGPPNNQYAKPSSFISEIPSNLVFTSIGYSSKPMPGLPFDSKKGIIPNENGRVQKGIYVCGWIKRGPSGIIGTNKYDAEEVVQTIVSDLQTQTEGAESTSSIGGRVLSSDSSPLSRIKHILHTRHIKPVTFHDWGKIDTEELLRGTQRDKLREKIKSVAEMLDIVNPPSL